MSDDRQVPEEGNKTLMFDPAQTEAFKKMARLARQQSDGDSAPAKPQAPAAPVVPAGVVPTPSRAPQGEIDEASANKTMMLSASELAKLRPVGSPLPSNPTPKQPAPATVAIDPTKTVVFGGPVPGGAAWSGVPDELAVLSRGLDGAINKSRTPTPPLGIQAVSPQQGASASQGYAGQAPQAGMSNQTMAYTPEQMAQYRQGLAGGGDVGGQTMMYNAAESNELKEAFDLLKRHQAMEAERNAQARAEAEALLRGIGDEPRPAAEAAIPASPLAEPSVNSRSEPAAQFSSPLSAPSEGAGISRQQLPLTGAPMSPRQAAVLSGTHKFETGKPRKSGAGKVILVVLLVAVGAALVAGGLHYLEVIELPFLK